MTSPEQLENLQSLGRQALEEAAKSYEPPKTLGSADLSVGPVPVVQGSVSEQPVQRPQEDVVGNAIRMEAKLVCELDYGIIELCYLSNENRYQRNFALAPSCF